MRIIIIAILFFIGKSIQAQVAIGKNTVDGHGLLDFGTQNKGIVLPVVNINSSTHSDGTLLVDDSDFTIKVKENGVWLNLSDEGDITTQQDQNNNNITTERTLNTSSELGEGVIIGSDTSSVNGVLILESPDMALILPKVANPHMTINSPTIGTIVYDTASKSLAVFDGKVWSFWK